MATTHIALGTNKTNGAKLLQAVIAGQNFRSDLREIKAKMETMIDYANPDENDPTRYAVLATEFGLPEGTGQTVYNLVAGTLALIEQSDYNNMVIRLG